MATAALALALIFPASHAAGEDLNFPTDLANNTDPISGDTDSLVPQFSRSGNTVTAGPGNILGYVYGGVDAGALNVYGNKVFINGATIGETVYGGGAVNGNAYDNLVTVTGGTIDGNVYGGGSTNGNAYNNTINVTGGTLGDSSTDRVSGGYSEFGQAYGNKLTIDGAGTTIAGYANGGESYEGDVFDNTLIINDGRIDRVSYGGYTGTTSGTSGKAYGNTLIINNGSFGSSVAGGRSEAEGDVYKNTATVYNGSFDAGASIYGGRSSIGKALDNTLTIYNGNFTNNDVYGGKGEDDVLFTGGGEASDNTANIFGGAGIDNVYGGYSVTSHAKNNKVNISGTLTINGTTGVTGGYSGDTGDVTGNRVSIGDTVTVTGYVIGGQSDGAGTVSGNSLKIFGTIGENVYGGFSNGTGNVTGNTIDFSGTIGNKYLGAGMSTNGEATGNSLTIRQSANIGAGASLLGGYSYVLGVYDVFSGNTLTIENRGVMTFAEVNNFEYYNLTLPTVFGAGDTLISVTSVTHLNNEQNIGQLAQFNINTAGDAPLKNVGDYFTVIDNTDMHGGAKYENTAWGLQGIGVRYDYVLENQSAVAPPQELIATITRAGANPDTGGLLYGNLGSGVFLNQGADFAIDRGMDAAIGAQLIGRDESCGRGGWSRRLFGVAGFGTNKQDTGGSVDVKGLNLLLGMSLGNNSCDHPLTAALFLEGGRGKYDGRAEVSGGADINSRGDLSYFGGGVMGKAEQLLGNLYLEGSFRFGRSKSEYKDGDFYVPQYLGGVLPEFDIEGNYLGAHLGLGYVFEINESMKLDTSVKYLWSRLEGDSVAILGDRFHFDDIDSHRLQAGGRLSWATESRKAEPYVGAWYEHEFDGKAGGTVRGLKIPGSDTKGSSGLLEAGVKLHTSQGGPLIDIGLSGAFGQREGFGGHAALRWEF